METARANDTPRYLQIAAEAGFEALRAALVAEARTWLDTPFSHQQRRKGAGVDCIGVPSEVGRLFGMPRCEDVPYAYTRQPNAGELIRQMEGRLNRVPYRHRRLADLFLTKAGIDPTHLAMIVSVTPLIVLHASLKRGKVIEHLADKAWRIEIDSCWRYRGIDG